nr:glycosyl hydrolase family 28 protein [Candidatus Sigynarchaeota archaeon]
MKDFGATGNGTTNDAKAIDAAIVACSKSGGGIVHFPPGRYISGTIHVKSNITVDISPGATIAMGSDDDVDDIEELGYDPGADHETIYFRPSLFYLDGIENACIQGGGRIDGNRSRRLGPKTIAVKRCTRVTIRDITIVNAPNYAISFIDSENLDVNNVRIANAFADGIDLDGCRFARVSNCRVDSRDDAICLKSSPALGEQIDCAHVVITNCILLTSATCFKLGTESGPGDFTDITVSNCTFAQLPGTNAHPGGISILSVDGAAIERLAIANITMHQISSPICLRLGRRGRGQKTPTPGSLQDISITGIVATDASFPCVISGVPGYRVKNVAIQDVGISFDTASAKHHVETIVRPADVPEFEDKYPDSGMFGALPAWAFYCRHADNVKVRRTQARIDASLANKKDAVVLDDVLHSHVEIDKILL